MQLPTDKLTTEVKLKCVVGFFFSSRRRHTRSLRDWSSDVCSSDLHGLVAERRSHPVVAGGRRVALVEHEIGRASCRERVEISGVGVALKKKGVKVQWSSDQHDGRPSLREKSSCTTSSAPSPNCQNS